MISSVLAVAFFCLILLSPKGSTFKIVKSLLLVLGVTACFHIYSSVLGYAYLILGSIFESLRLLSVFKGKSNLFLVKNKAFKWKLLSALIVLIGLSLLFSFGNASSANQFYLGLNTQDLTLALFLLFGASSILEGGKLWKK